MKKLITHRSLSIIGIVGILLALWAGGNALAGYWTNSQTGTIESRESISHLLDDPEREAVPGKTVAFFDRVRNADPSVVYGMDYDVFLDFTYSWEDGGFGGLGSISMTEETPVMPTEVTSRFRIADQGITEDGDVILTTPIVKDDSAAIAGGPCCFVPPAKVRVFVDPDGDGPQGSKIYSWGRTTNITDSHTVIVEVRSGADSPPGRWLVSIYPVRGEPALETPVLATPSPIATIIIPCPSFTICATE